MTPMIRVFLGIPILMGAAMFFHGTSSRTLVELGSLGSPSLEAGLLSPECFMVWGNLSSRTPAYKAQFLLRFLAHRM